MDFQSQIATISQEQLDSLFNDTPETTVTVNNLEATTNPNVRDEDKKEVSPRINMSDRIDFVDTDTIDVDEEEEKEEKIETPIIEEEPKPKKDKKPKPEEEEIPPVTSDDAKAILKNTVDFLIQSGNWSDFEGREDMEFDDDSFGKLALAQDQSRVQSMFSELLDETGEYGKAIISHIKNGGNPDEVIDIFKEQKQLATIDTNTFEGRVEKIEAYYTDVIGWKPEKIKRYLERISQDQDEFDTEFTEVEEKYNEYYQEKLDEINERTNTQKKEQEQKKQQFVSNIKNVLEARTDLTKKDQGLIESALFNYKYKLPNGQQVNEFFVKFAELQKDPQAYVDLVLYVMDKKRVVEKQNQTIAKKESIKQFNFVKGNTAVKKKTTGGIVKEIDDSKINRTDFSSLFK
jgi:hypothetical protein